MINVYVAGASRNKERARAFMDRVRAEPTMILTHDWVADIDAADAACKTDRDFDTAARLRFAEADLDGLAEADVAVFLLEAEPMSRGSYVELGYAIAVREVCGPSDIKPRIIVSGGGRRSIFTVPGLVDHEVSYDDVEQCDAAAWHALVQDANAPGTAGPLGHGPESLR